MYNVDAFIILFEAYILKPLKFCAGLYVKKISTGVAIARQLFMFIRPCKRPVWEKGWMRNPLALAPDRQSSVGVSLMLRASNAQMRCTATHCCAQSETTGEQPCCVGRTLS